MCCLRDGKHEINTRVPIKSKAQLIDIITLIETNERDECMWWLWCTMYTGD